MAVAPPLTPQAMLIHGGHYVTTKNNSTLCHSSLFLPLQEG